MISATKITHLSPEQIAECADAMNSGTFELLKENVRSHLEECHLCAEEAVNVAELTYDPENFEIPHEAIIMKPKKEPGKIKPFRRNVIAYMSAAAAILAVVMIVNHYWFDSIDTQQIADSEIESRQKDPLLSNRVPVEEKNNVLEPEHKGKLEEKVERDVLVPDAEEGQFIDSSLLARFKPNPALEQLYGNMQGTYRGQNIKVTSPSEIDYNHGIRLNWENPRNESLHFELFDNAGEEIFAETTTGESFELPSLDPGLYYWKLIGEEFDLYFVGKIHHTP